MSDTIHSFDSTGAAYDACQCDDTLATDGQTLLIEAEGVAGLSGTWPVAVTEAYGHFHQVAVGIDPCEPGKPTFSEDDCRRAVALAIAKGYAIDAPFARFVAEPTK